MTAEVAEAAVSLAPVWLQCRPRMATFLCRRRRPQYGKETTTRTRGGFLLPLLKEGRYVADRRRTEEILPTTPGATTGQSFFEEK